MYFAAREPAEILSVSDVPFVGFGVGVLNVFLVVMPAPGVALPAAAEGVTRPLEKEAEGVRVIE